MLTFTEIGGCLGISRQAASNAFYSGVKKLEIRFGPDAVEMIGWADRTRAGVLAYGSRAQASAGRAREGAAGHSGSLLGRRKYGEAGSGLSSSGVSSSAQAFAPGLR